MHITNTPIAANVIRIPLEEFLITEQSSPEKRHKNNFILLEGCFTILYF